MRSKMKAMIMDILSQKTKCFLMFGARRGGQCGQKEGFATIISDPPEMFLCF